MHEFASHQAAKYEEEEEATRRRLGDAGYARKVGFRLNFNPNFRTQTSRSILSSGLSGPIGLQYAPPQLHPPSTPSCPRVPSPFLLLSPARKKRTENKGKIEAQRKKVLQDKYAELQKHNKEMIKNARLELVVEDYDVASGNDFMARY